MLAEKGQATVVRLLLKQEMDLSLRDGDKITLRIYDQTSRSSIPTMLLDWRWS